jgi:hypothetical protein
MTTKMVQCNLCGLSFNKDEDLGNHKKEEHTKGEKIPTLAQTSAQLIREQAIAHEAGQDASFGFGVGDPKAAAETEDKDKKVTTTTTSTTAKKPGEK